MVRRNSGEYLTHHAVQGIAVIFVLSVLSEYLISEEPRRPITISAVWNMEMLQGWKLSMLRYCVSGVKTGHGLGKQRDFPTMGAPRFIGSWGLDGRQCWIPPLS